VKTPLYFMHITKTAGGSLKETLRKSKETVKFHYPEEPGFKRYFSYPKETDIVFGHYIFGAHSIADMPPNYACFVRDPVARTFSHYHHLKNNDKGPIGNSVRTFDTIDLALSNMKHWEFDNFLCRLISGVGATAKFGDVGFNTYEAARKNLKFHFRYIGVFEAMDASIKRLNKLIPSLGMDLPTVNLGDYKREIPAVTRELLIRLNRYDELLYQDAVELAAKM
jgi:Sulfotransferase family